MKKPLHPTVLVAIVGTAGFLGTLSEILNAPVLVVVSIPVELGYWVCQLIFLYQMWKLVQTSDLPIKKPTPGKAIGFWFIPFFGLYWMFIVWRNLALHVNHLVGQRLVSVTLVTTACGLFIPGAIGVRMLEKPPAEIQTVGGFLSLLYLAAVVIFLIADYQFYRSANVLIHR